MYILVLTLIFKSIQSIFFQDVETAMNVTTGHMLKTHTTASGAATLGSVWTMQVWKSFSWLLSLESKGQSDQAASPVVLVPHLGHVTMAPVEQLKGFGLFIWNCCCFYRRICFHQIQFKTATATHGGTAKTQTSSGTLRFRQTTIHR